MSRGIFSSSGMGLPRSEEHTSELQSLRHLVCRLLLEKKKHHSPQPLRWERGRTPRWRCGRRAESAAVAARVAALAGGLGWEVKLARLLFFFFNKAPPPKFSPFPPPPALPI